MNGRVLRFRFPFPPTELRTNSRRTAHWGAKYRVGREYAHQIAAEIRATLGPPPWPVFQRATLAITAVFPNRRMWDDTAVLEAFKQGRDVFTAPRKTRSRNPPPRLGLLPDDSPDHLRTEIEIRVDPTAGERYLLVELREHCT